MSKSKNEEPRARPVNPLIRFVGNRLGCALLVLVLIFGGCGATALFLPDFFQRMITTVRQGGLSVYTLVLSVTGNPTLQVVTNKVTVSATTKITRDVGFFGLFFGESATLEGKLFVSLGADLKTGQFGVLACEVDPSTLRDSQNRSFLSGTAFDQNEIKQEAYTALSSEAAKSALAQFWPTAKKDLEGQFVSWGLGVKVPEVPTLQDCPANVKVTPTPVK